jgi:hypothetical protein
VKKTIGAMNGLPVRLTESSLCDLASPLTVQMTQLPHADGTDDAVLTAWLTRCDLRVAQGTYKTSPE